MRSCYFKTPRPGGPKIQGPAAGHRFMVLKSYWALDGDWKPMDSIFWHFFETWNRQADKLLGCSWWHLGIGLKATVDTFASFPIWNPISFGDHHAFVTFVGSRIGSSLKKNAGILKWRSFLTDFSPNQTRTSGLSWLSLTTVMLPWYPPWN